MVSFAKPSGHITAYISVVFSATVIVACWVATIQLLHTIHSFRDEIMEDLDEFKVIAEDAWNGMIDMRNANLFRIRRSAFDYGNEGAGGGYAQPQRAQCNCAAQRNRCPTGPPGPPGMDGLPGEMGERGADGRPGAVGVSLVYRQKQPGCISCPMGPPGPPGFDGPMGSCGPSGEPGIPGAFAQMGKPGPMGPMGDPGHPGTPGHQGLPGPNGENGERGYGSPGLPGPPGDEGAPGNPGQPGYSPPMGPPGQMGLMGPPGHPGQPGGIGRPGYQGPVGAPGVDAQYCPCPNRSGPVRQVSEVYRNQYATQTVNQGYPYSQQSLDYRRRLFAKLLRAKHRKLVVS